MYDIIIETVIPPRKHLTPLLSIIYHHVLSYHILLVLLSSQSHSNEHSHHIITITMMTMMTVTIAIPICKPSKHLPNIYSTNEYFKAQWVTFCFVLLKLLRLRLLDLVPTISNLQSK